ncbi:uncharacterized protein ACNS7B_003182, partial [Menidia menidia]
GVLPAVLAALRRRGANGRLRPAGDPRPGRRHRAPSLLAKSSTVINPVLYILLNKQFLRCFLVLLRCRPPQAELGPSSMPSRSTAVPMTRRPGPAPPGSGPAPPGSGPAPPGSGPAPPGSGPAPHSSGPAHPDGTSAGDPPLHDLSSC